MKAEYRAIDTKIECQTSDGHYIVSSQQGSPRKRVPGDLDTSLWNMARTSDS